MSTVGHVVTIPPEPLPLHGSRLVVYGIPAATDNLVWLIVDTQTGTAAAVDGPEAGAVLEVCERLGVRLTAILNTHTHGDHVGINRDLVRRGELTGMRVIGPAKVASDIPGLTQPVDEASNFTFGDASFSVWLTEGHLDGHVSYLAHDALFCGDTLFAGGCGYLFSGPPVKMFESLFRFKMLPANTRVFCAHEYTIDNLAFALSVEPGNQALVDRISTAAATRNAGRSTVPSTIADEIATNPFMRWDSAELVASVRAALPDARLETPLDVFTATRKLKDLKRYRR